MHSILNPLFSKATRFILKEILRYFLILFLLKQIIILKNHRLLGKTVLYFEVHQRTLLPDIFNELIFVRARTFPHFLKRKWDFEHDEEHFERAGDKQEILDGTRGKLIN